MTKQLARIRAVAVVGVLMALGSLTATACAFPPNTRVFPTHIDLPNGFRPEGIVIGQGTTFYVGSIPTGALYRGDLRTGQGEVITPGAASGSASIGLAIDDHELVYVAGGATGQGRVIDGRTGAVLATYQLSSETPTFVNDVVVSKDFAWFTDSMRTTGVLYRVPLGGDPTAVPQTIPLTPPSPSIPLTGLNGIDVTPDGKTLIVVQSDPGRLFTVNPETGVASLIDLAGEFVPNGDGILLDGQTLYVVQNRLNQLAVITLSDDLTSGTVDARVPLSDVSVPTTIDRFFDRLYVVNARFGQPMTPDTQYWVTGFTIP
jgi:sugar lactone lactonase YvrE